MEVLFLFLLIIGLLLIGAPIGVSLGLSSIIFLLVYSDTSLASIAQQLFNAMFKHFTLLAIPFFILASSFMSTGGVARRIIRFANATVGHIRGGLGIASVMACMLFAAISGSSPATVVAIGSITIAEMQKYGYKKEFAAGVIANAGTLGILIPPSIVMVVYATATDVSVGRLFLAGVIPGLLAGSMLMVGIYVAALRSGMPKGKFVGWGEFFASLLDASWGLFLMVIILGGIYGGLFTPTEAAAVASVYAFLVALFVYRDMGPLKSKPWLLDEERAVGLLGARVIGFAIVTCLLYVIAVFLYNADTRTETDLPMGLAWGAGAVFALICLLLGALYARLAGTHNERWLTLSAVLVLGVAPSLWAVRALWQWGDASVSLRVILSLLAVLFLMMSPLMMIYSYQRAAHGLKETGGTYGQSLRVGGYAILRGLGQCMLWALPAGFHPSSRDTIFDAARLTIMLMFIIANALILKHVLTDEQIPQHLAELMLSAGFGKIMFLLMVNLILLIGGQFMEPSGLIVIVAPLVFPIAISLGVDPIHLGVIMVVNMELGMITPPVGLNLFVTSGVANMSMMGVVRAALPWLMILFVFLIIVTYIPAVSTWLPISVMGPETIIK